MFIANSYHIYVNVCKFEKGFHLSIKTFDSIINFYDHEKQIINPKFFSLSSPSLTFSKKNIDELIRKLKKIK
ncbi:MAG: hypothetical protein DI598_15640 [Pseudopedobacter saltans]|uniref:Uncharacterized protein n=1 Tax=Pseudopedobacter saltans TaxID=151895 RepID=A0A2W5ENL5_9SPHI|nr:MAG: hypothetical protein DI598_15640 [Pseudopedobacter saltans]